MKANHVVCNYAIVRFLPYPETSEFVNLGVVVACPSRRYFGLQMMPRTTSLPSPRQVEQSTLP